MELGPSFLWTERVWLGQGECLARLRRPRAMADTEGYWLHPGLLDACFQVAGAALSRDTAAGSMLPFGLKCLKAHRVADGNVWWCHARQVAATRWDIQLSDDDGQVVLEIDGFEMRPASRDAFLFRQMADWLYVLEWQPQPLTGEARLHGDTGSWLIIADGDDLGEKLAAGIRGHGQQCVVASSHGGADPSDDFGRLLKTALPTGSSGWHGIVYLPGRGTARARHAIRRPWLKQVSTGCCT